MWLLLLLSCGRTVDPIDRLAVEEFEATGPDPSTHFALGHRLGTGRAHGVGRTSPTTNARTLTFDRGVLVLTADGHSERIVRGTPFAGTAEAIAILDVAAWAASAVERLDPKHLPRGPFRFRGEVQGSSVGDCGTSVGRTIDRAWADVIGFVNADGVHAHLLANPARGIDGHLVELGVWGPGTLERPDVR